MWLERDLHVGVQWEERGYTVQVSEYWVRNLDFNQQAVQSYHNCCYYSGKIVNIFRAFAVCLTMC